MGDVDRKDDENRLAALRVSYQAPPLLMEHMPLAPGAAFEQWFAAAQQMGIPEPNAMVLATVGEDGTPSARTVLLKAVTDTGFRFYTNYQSRKARQIAAHPTASALFVWLPLHRQVCVTGEVVKVPQEASDRYFANRPRDSQVAAWASPQSQVVTDRETLWDAVSRYEQRFAGQPVQRPPHWGGFELRPIRIEFWQGQPSRMHDRIEYHTRTGTPAELAADSKWLRHRLAP